jgi:hypothetical protein
MCASELFAPRPAEELKALTRATRGCVIVATTEETAVAVCGTGGKRGTQ